MSGRTWLVPLLAGLTILCSAWLALEKETLSRQETLQLSTKLSNHTIKIVPWGNSSTADNLNRSVERKEALNITNGVETLCTRSEMRKGRWVPRSLDAPLYYPHYRRRCRRLTDNQLRTTHDWVPEANCRFLPFNATRMCELMDGKHVALFGDSLMTEIVHSMLYQLGHLNAYEIEAAPITNGGNISTACGNTSSVTILGTGFGLGEDEAEIIQTLHRFQPDILVLNRGAHFVTDDILMPDMTRLVEILKNYTISRQGEGVRMFWKTTSPGHPNCWEFTQPSHNTSMMVEMVQNQNLYNFHPGAPNFHWWDFDRQNQMVLNLFETNLTTMEILDGYDLLLSRPDLHRARNRKRFDCLHHCYPGPQDIFPQLLYHYLNMEHDDVKVHE